MSDSKNFIVHVEIQQKAVSSLNAEDIEKNVRSYLNSRNEMHQNELYAGEDILSDHIDYVRICFNSDDEYVIKLDRVRLDLRFYVYQNFSIVPQYDTIEEESDDSPVACLSWSLPNSEFEGLWESLVIDGNIKNQLLSYVQTALLYGKNQVSKHIIRWNGVVLLHGPPGTATNTITALTHYFWRNQKKKIQVFLCDMAVISPEIMSKTSLCKALAHKLSIRLSNSYSCGHLIEINTHSLFSKWYSESPKLVFKMFKTIKQWLEFEDNFVCILMDEVESLIHSRQSTGSDPTDSIRVVNTVLTQLDQLQSYRNFVILATSNVTDAIDIAFADRADLKLYLDYPDQWGAYEILSSGMKELVRCKLISVPENNFIETNIFKTIWKSKDVGKMEHYDNSLALLNVSKLCKGLSGRTLRKIPFLTSTKFFDMPLPSGTDFLMAMENIVINHKNENGIYFNGKSSVKGNETD